MFWLCACLLLQLQVCISVSDSTFATATINSTLIKKNACNDFTIT